MESLVFVVGSFKENLLAKHIWGWSQLEETLAKSGTIRASKYIMIIITYNTLKMKIINLYQYKGINKWEYKALFSVRMSNNQGISS